MHFEVSWLEVGSAGYLTALGLKNGDQFVGKSYIKMT